MVSKIIAECNILPTNYAVLKFLIKLFSFTAISHRINHAKLSIYYITFTYRYTILK